MSLFDFFRRSWDRVRGVAPVPRRSSPPRAVTAELPPASVRASSAPLAAPAPPDSLEAQAAAAVRAFSERNFDEADRLAAAAIALLDAAHPTSDALALRSNLLAVRGAAAAHRDRWPEATALLNESLDVARRSGRDDAIGAALLNLVDAALRRGAPIDAETHLPEAIERVRGSRLGDFLGKVILEGGIARVRAGDLEGSVRLFDRAVGLRPDWPTPYYQRAWSRFIQGDGGGALDDYREAAARTPVFFTVQREVRCLEDIARGELDLDVYRAFCAVREEAQRKPAETEGVARRLLERAPRFTPALLLLADALRHQNKAADARATIRRVLTADPDPDTAAAALFLEWDLARRAGDADGATLARDRLLAEHAHHPGARILASIPSGPAQSFTVRWSWALDGTLHVETSDPPAPDGPV